MAPGGLSGGCAGEGPAGTALALVLDGVHTAGVSPVDGAEDGGHLELVGDVLSGGGVSEEGLVLLLSPVGHLVVASLVGVFTRVSVVLLDESVLESGREEWREIG